MRRGMYVPVAFVVAGSLVLGGCGSSAETSDTSPLQAIFGGSESPAESRAKQLKAEELTAQCMKELGWEYTPVDYSAQFPDQGEELDYSDPKFGEKYGYGIVKGYELYELPGLIGGDDPNSGPEGSFVDPNQDYINALSSDERDRYYTDLYGDQSSPVPFEGDTEGTTYVAPPLEQMGCQGKSQAEVYGNQPWSDQDFSQRFDQLSQDMQNDPRLQDGYIAWSDCMYELDENLDFLDPTEVQNYFSKQLAEAKGQRVLPLDVETGEPIGDYDPNEGYSSTVNADGTGWAFVGNAKVIDDATLKLLQTAEIDLWKSDNKCQKDTGLKDLQRRMEQELADALTQEFPDLVGQS